MSLPSSVRSLVPLVIGLAVGVAGATMFVESMPGTEGSPEERATRLGIELKRAQNRIAALEAEANSTERRPRGLLERIAGDRIAQPGENEPSMADAARRIAEDIREGRPVSPDDVFRATQPLIRDLAPLFDRMRIRQQQRVIDSMAGELARKYDLTPQNQEMLKRWFERKTNEEAKRWNELITRDGTRFEDVIRAPQNVRPDEGLDAFMPNILSGDRLESFRTERMAERAGASSRRRT